MVQSAVLWSQGSACDLSPLANFADLALVRRPPQANPQQAKACDYNILIPMMFNMPYL